MIRLLHAAVKGRARYKVDGLYRCEPLKAHLALKLAGMQAISWFSASTLTGNVLIRFNSGSDPHSIASLVGLIVNEYHAQGAVRDRGKTGDKPQDGQKLVRSSGHTPEKTAQPSAIRTRLAEFWQGVEPQPVAAWHMMEADVVLAAWSSSRTLGLSSDAATQQLKKYGPNSLPESVSRSGFSIFIDQFKSLPVALLAAAAGLSVVTGGVADAMVILAVVGINGTIGYVTESAAEKTIQSLQHLVRPQADVIRDAQPVTVAAEQLVPGDIQILRPGTYIAADSRLIEAEHLSVDESVLTGESLPVAKTVEPIAGEHTPLADRVSMVYMGTLVTGGQGLAVVVATGAFTEVGMLQQLVSEADAPETPMERQLNRLGNQLVAISGAACGVVFFIGLLRGYGFLAMLKTAISLAVAAVPEGLPAVATTTLALGIRRMLQHRVLIRHLDAVETLGSVQTICFDKTGTITRNKMSVIRIHTGMKSIAVDEGRFSCDGGWIDPLRCEELLRTIQAVALCNETRVTREQGEIILNGSPTENALIHLAMHAAVDVIRLREQYPLLKTSYRSENRMFMGTLHAVDDHSRLIAWKGSPLEVLAMCGFQIKDGRKVPLSEDDLFQIELENERMAGAALRVLGVAYCEAENDEDLAREDGCLWLGLIGMADPVRPGVKELIDQFHQAGIDTVMITGDQSATAYAIGKELDLSRGRQLEILDSTHLADLGEEVIQALAERVQVFARVSPAHKLQIVLALQRSGRVVAMTGDGINDGPALKAADIGIAMGIAGTDIAREVADVVLEEDNLETMIIAVRDGRTIYDNIRKALHFLLATNFSEIMVMFLAVAAGLGAPLNAMQLLWINLISDIFPGLALALEPPEPGVLHRPPRPPEEPIVKTADFKRLTFESAALSISAMGAYGYGVMKYGVGPRASTMVFQGLTLGQLLHAISCRSEHHSVFSREKLPPNNILNAALGASLAMQVLTLVVPGLRRLLGTTPIGVMDGMVVGASAVLPFIVNEATKGR